jgi:spore coat polysaccharide biosynthesis protein SpsF (cytidylyltransferase family)
MARAVAIIQARLRSQRLPGKVMAELGGQAMIARVVERARGTTLVDEVMLAVPWTEQPMFCSLFPGLSVFGGPDEDVLERYRGAAAQAMASIIVRVTSDCPCLDPAEADRVIAHLRDAGGDLDYASNVFPERSVPDGFDVEAFTWPALVLASLHTREAYDREHVTVWMREHLRCGSVAIRPELMTFAWEGLKLSVDTVDDYLRVRRILKAAPATTTMVDLVAAALEVR